MPENMQEAKKQNILYFAYLANYFYNLFIAALSTIIAFVAITKAFLEHYLSASK